jgi:hypothetical protein
VLWISIHGQSIDSTAPPELLSAANKAGMFLGSTASRVGLLIRGSDQIVVLPEFYLPHAEEREKLLNDVSLLRAVLRKYEQSRRVIDECAAGESLIRGAKGALDLSEILSFLVADFKLNGSLKRHKESLTPNGVGQLMWPRTLSGSNWIEGSEGGEFLPKDLWYRKRVPLTSDAIAVLHRHALRIANQVLKGGLLGEFSLPPDERDIQSIGAIDQKLVAELTRTFRQRERRVLTALRDLYSQTCWRVNSKSTFAVSYYFLVNFEYVWEDLLRNGIEAEVSDELPMRGTTTHENGITKAGIQPIPDLTIRLPAGIRKRCGLIDGKYYMSGGKDPVGSAGDHYKQIIYAQLLELDGFDVEFNLLAFPIAQLADEHCARLLRLHGWSMMHASSVHECAIDYRQLARAYVQSSKRVELNQLLGDLSISTS